MNPLFMIANLKGYMQHRVKKRYIGGGILFEFRVVCYKLESLSEIVAYVSKHQSLDIFEFRNIERKQIFHKQI